MVYISNKEETTSDGVKMRSASAVLLSLSSCSSSRPAGAGRPKHARLCELARTEQLRVAHSGVQQLLAVVYCGIHIN